MSALLKHLLVATDGSDNGNRAVAFAVAVARRHGSELLLVYAIDHAGAIAECSVSNGGGELLFPLVEALDDAAASILADAAKQATDAGVVATTSVLEGRSVPAIVDCAKDRAVDAIVIGTQGKSALEQFFLGSTAAGVLRHTDVPVFVVAPGASEPAPAFERILVAVDNSDPSDAAAAFALELAQADKAELVYCGVAETGDLFEKAAMYGFDPRPMLDELRATAGEPLSAQAERARERNVAVETVIAEGEPAEEILKTAETQKAGSIVIGTHGRRGLRRMFVGSVAENVVRRSPVPVVVVRVSGRYTPSASGAAVAASTLPSA